MKKIGFIGAGSIADSLLTGFINKNLVTSENLIISNRQNLDRLQYFEETFQCRTTQSKQEVMEKSEIVFLLMKPKDAKQSLQELSPFIKKTHIFVSVIAGLEISSIKEFLRTNNSIIRVMPNTSASIGLAATAMCACSHTDEQTYAYIVELFQSVGYVAQVEEKHMNAVTGLSGSGPAFLYYFVEGMLESGIKLGLDKTTTQELVYQTILGAAHMLSESQKSPQILRKEVTSPNGTTQAGLEVLDKYDFHKAINSCITRATERSKELSKAVSED